MNTALGNAGAFFSPVMSGLYEMIIMFFYNIEVQPITDRFDYYAVQGVAFPNPVHKGDLIEIDGNQAKVYQVLHEIGHESWLYVKSDEKLTSI